MQGKEDLLIKVVDYRLSRTGLSSYYVDVIVNRFIKIYPTYSKWCDNDWTTDGIHIPFISHQIDWSLYPVYRGHFFNNDLVIVPKWRDFDPQDQSNSLREVVVEVFLDGKMERLPVVEITGNNTTKDNRFVRYQFKEIPFRSTRKAFRTLKALKVINPEYAEPVDTPIGRKLGICSVGIGGRSYLTWDWLHYYSNPFNLFEDLNNLFELPGYYWQFEHKIINGRSIGILIKYVNQDFEAIGETVNMDGTSISSTSYSPEHYLEDIVRELNI